MRRRWTTNHIAAVALLFTSVWVVALRLQEYNQVHLQQSPIVVAGDDLSEQQPLASSEGDEFGDGFAEDDKPSAAETRKWRSASARRTRRTVTDAELPTISGLPILADDDDGDKQRGRLARDEIFVTRANYNKLLGSAYGKQDPGHYERSFPLPQDVDSILSDAFPSLHDLSCAVVGSSGSLLNASFGSAIDSHAAVLRINQAPAGGPNKYRKLKRHVGVKVIPSQWTLLPPSRPPPSLPASLQLPSHPHD